MAVAFVIDSSGSTEKFYQQFASELDAVLAQVQPESVFVMGDTKVADSFTLDHGSRLQDLEIKGGGGTVLAPLFEHLDDPHCEAVVCLTDLEMHEYIRAYQSARPTTHLIRIDQQGSLEAPIGTTIYM